jgi:hypothetical protein
MTIVTQLRTIGPAILALAAATMSAAAQGMPPPSALPGAAAPPPGPSQNPVCSRLEAQIAALDRGGDPARADQIRRYEEAVQGQQAELDRTVAQARRTGCEGSGFFLFGRSQPPQCDDLNSRIQRMRANLDRLNSDLQQLTSSARGAADGQRRQILAALGQNDCGPQYRSAAAPARPRGFFEALFGGGGSGSGGISQPPFGSGDMTPSDQSSTYRTICVRTCDGYYFPVSYAASPAKFRDDEQACQRMCPASEVMLFTYRNPGEDVAQSVSTTGQPYTSLANAFRYRQEFNPSCSCRRPGESWADTLRNQEDTTVERGDIIVTEENAKALAQPKPDAPARGKQSPRAAKSGPTSAAPTAEAAPSPAPSPATPTPVTAAPLPDAAAPAADAAPPPEPRKGPIRTVGPPFIVR